jgi:thiol:disulfide interchange protein DsbC
MKVNRFFKALTVAVILAAGSSGSAAAESEATVSRNALTGHIRATEKLPVAGMTAVESDDVDGLVFMSDNGRYVIRGTLYDTWQGRAVKTLDDIRDTASRIDFHKLGINPDDLGAMDVGSGDKEVEVFVDPNCEPCHAMLQQLPALEGKYRFHLLVIPALGKESERRTRLLSCATDQGAALKTLLAGLAPDALDQDPNCNLAQTQKRFISAQLFSVKGVPTIIAPDGREHSGVPQDLDGWLSGGRS